MRANTADVVDGVDFQQLYELKPCAKSGTTCTLVQHMSNCETVSEQVLYARHFISPEHALLTTIARTKKQIYPLHRRHSLAYPTYRTGIAPGPFALL